MGYEFFEYVYIPELDISNITENYDNKIDLYTRLTFVKTVIISYILELGIIPFYLDPDMSFKKESIDIIHIDGNHNEESVSKDIKNYFPLIKQGGIIMMDDSDWKGVRNSIDKLLTGKTELQISNKHLEIYIKK